MFKKIVELQAQLQAEKVSLLSEVKELQSSAADNSKLEPFNEYQAATRITNAKSNDHLEGTKTAKEIIKQVDKEREETHNKLEEMAAHKTEVEQQLLQKQAELRAVKSEIDALDLKLKSFIDTEAKQRLASKVKDYRQTATELLSLLIDIDALNAVFTENPGESPIKYVLGIQSLPAIGTDNLEEIHPWVIQQSGQKLIFTREAALPAVQERKLAIINDIKGSLNEHK